MDSVGKGALTHERVWLFFHLPRREKDMNFNVSTVTWVLIATALIYFTHAGFALCQAGITRAKNTGNILMKNMMDF